MKTKRTKRAAPKVGWNGVMDKPCGECPFRKTSARGWLGPWTAESIVLQAFSEAGLACHMTANDVATAKTCAGSLICANKSAKLYRDTWLACHQANLKASPEAKHVMNVAEFREHHGNGVRRR